MLMKVATTDNSQVDVRVIFDTGTEPNWISSDFLTDKLGLKFTRLNDEENKQEYIDADGNKINWIGKTELMVSSTAFVGFPSEMMSFLVAKGNFQIVLGRQTIRKEKLFYKPGENPPVQIDPKKGNNCFEALS
jgi:hypothetical protein